MESTVASINHSAMSLMDTGMVTKCHQSKINTLQSLPFPLRYFLHYNSEIAINSYLLKILTKI